MILTDKSLKNLDKVRADQRRELFGRRIPTDREEARGRKAAVRRNFQMLVHAAAARAFPQLDATEPARLTRVKPKECGGCEKKAIGAGDTLCGPCWRVAPYHLKRAYLAAWRMKDVPEAERLLARLVNTVQSRLRLERKRRRAA